jgi:hypothetical protein
LIDARVFGCYIFPAGAGLFEEPPMKKGMKDNRIEKRLKRELENLYGNEGLTRDMNDSSAKLFLDWAETHVRKIVDSTAELGDADAEEAMYPRLKAMRRIARYVNRVVRSQGEPYDLVEKIANQAKELYGEAYIELDKNKLQSLLAMPQIEASVFIQTLKHLLEGETNGEEKNFQQ